MDESGASAIQTSDGGFALVGKTDNEAYLVKYDVNLNELWTKTFNLNSGWGWHNPYDLQQTTDGGYIIFGLKYDNGNWNNFLIKTDINGVEQWNKILLNEDSWAGRHNIFQTNDGGYILSREMFLVVF